MTITDDRPIPIAAAADFLGVKVRYMRRLVAERRIRYLKPSPNILRFLPSDLERFIEGAAVEPARSEHGEARELVSTLLRTSLQKVS
jgi:excisionase family DNA binding protein